MSNLLTLTYICSIMSLLVAGMLLLCVKVAPQLTDKKYRRAKILLGIAFVVLSAGTMAQMDGISNGQNVDVFSAIVLSISTVQACMFTFVALTLLQSSYVTRCNILKHLTPTFFFVAIYLCSLLLWPDKSISSLDQYSFNVPLLIRTLFAGVYLSQIVIYITIFHRERRVYIEKTENYFADLGCYEAKWVSKLFYQATTVGIMVLCFIIFPSGIADHISTVVITLFYFSFGVGFINYQYHIIQVTPALKIEDSETSQDKLISQATTHTTLTPQTGVNTAAEPRIEAAEYDSTLEENLATQRLFLKQGVSLADYTAALGVPERKISLFIKNRFGQSFKRWVNTQRVEYAKSLLAQHPELNIDHIAEMSGFADKSQFSKTFREICEISFSAYKKEGVVSSVATISQN